MSWFQGAVNSFVNGVISGATGSAPANKNNEKTVKTAEKVDEARSKCVHNNNPAGTTGDDVTEHVLGWEFSQAWRDWCDMTKSKTDPITGRDRGESGDSAGGVSPENNGSDINSKDK